MAGPDYDQLLFSAGWIIVFNAGTGPASNPVKAPALSSSVTEALHPVGISFA